MTRFPSELTKSPWEPILARVLGMSEVTRPVPLPLSGRTYSSQRKVRLGDVTPKGRVRLDAVARYLQDIATDDSLDGNYSEPHSWVVRRTEMWVSAFPKYLEELHLTTWCGALGSHWAERRTQIATASGVAIETAALWVRVDFKTMKPAPLSSDLVELLSSATGGRKVSARLEIGRSLPPLDSHNSISQDWSIRRSDMDAVGHLNNAVYWEVLEEYLGAQTRKLAGLHATVEHHGAIDPGDSVRIVTQEIDTRVLLRHVLGTGEVAAVTQLIFA